MNTSQKNFMVPLAFVGMMFFAIGFALGINSFLMPVLERSMEMSASESDYSSKQPQQNLLYGFFSPHSSVVPPMQYSKRQ